MIRAQLLLVAILFGIGLLYFTRIRSKASDGLAFVAILGFAAFLVMRPTFATTLANLVGVGRGADLIFYLAIPGLAFLMLILLSKIRDLNAKLTVAIRDIALSNVRVMHENGKSEQ